jgi:hypothetical protein
MPSQPAPAAPVREDTVRHRETVERTLGVILERLDAIEQAMRELSARMPRDGDKWMVLEQDSDA